MTRVEALEEEIQKLSQAEFAELRDWILEKVEGDASLALNLFEAGRVTLSQGAKLAGLSLEGFIELLGQAGIAAVSYPAKDLEDEVEAAR